MHKCINDCGRYVEKKGEMCEICWAELKYEEQTFDLRGELESEIPAEIEAEIPDEI